MRKIISLIIFCLFFCINAFPLKENKYKLHIAKDEDSVYVDLLLYVEKDYSHQNYFLLSEVITIQQIKVNNNAPDYLRIDDTIFINNVEIIDNLEIKYAIPLKYYTDEGIVILKREGRWYPYRNDELLTAEIDFSDSSYFIICGQNQGEYHEVKTTNELHLFLLSKDSYNCTQYDGRNIPFYFYRNKNDTSMHEEAYFHEFINSYDFYVSFFDHNLSKQPVHIIEVFNNDFQICQSLKGVVIFGNMFYQIYLQFPFTSWISHEIAHQWWGNTLFFMNDTNRLFLEESLTEYIKIQYIRSKKNGYDELMKSYSHSISEIGNTIRIKDISDLKTRDAQLIIYNLAPFLLEKIAISYPRHEINELLKTTFNNFKNKIINYRIFSDHIPDNLMKNEFEKLLSEKHSVSIPKSYPNQNK